MSFKEDDRKLVYALHAMPYVRITALAKQFIELTPEEYRLTLDKTILLILTRVRDEGKLEAFRTAVFEQKAKDDAK